MTDGRFYLANKLSELNNFPGFADDVVLHWY